MPNKPFNKEQSCNTQINLGNLPLAKGMEKPFHINEPDLNEHFYIIGRSGTGKTNLLQELAIADMEHGRGLCFIDPIGNAAETLLTHIPTEHHKTKKSDASCRDHKNQNHDPLHRATTSDSGFHRAEPNHNPTSEQKDCFHSANEDINNPVKEKPGRGRDKDVIYIDFADTDFPIGINPLYNVAVEDRPRIVSDILQMFSGIWHDSGWGPRMESIFRAALHTLIENPHCMRPSLLTVFRLLLDEEFRKTTKQDITNPQLLDWWNFRFDRGDLNERTRREWVEPVLNKIDTLSLDPLIRNIIGQPRCSLDFDEIIARRQILIINLNQNKIGLDNAAFLGMLIISRLRQAAAKAGKRDVPFSISIDEAHSFPTMELAKIVTQGRHSGLYARIAHQHLDQFDPKISSVLRNGCGSLAVFAVGNKDAETIVDDLEAMHRERSLDIIRNLGRGECLLRLTQNGTPQSPPSYPVAITKRKEGSSKPQSAINFTRQRFGTDRLTAEFQITSSQSQLDPSEMQVWKVRFNEIRKDRAKTQKTNRISKQMRKRDPMQVLGDTIFKAKFSDL